MAVERRINPFAAEVRSDGDGTYITGYASVFNKLSRKLGGFVERVNQSAFNESRNAGWPDVVCRYNHNDDFLLGTTSAGTLRLGTDSTGLSYYVSAPKSRADIVELCQRGDVQHSSFAFRVPDGGDEWGLSDFNYPQRTLLNVELVDVAPVVTPAYPDATAGIAAVNGAVESLARRFDADPEEVRSMLDSGQGVKLFKSTRTKTVTTNNRNAGRLRELYAKRIDPYWTPDSDGDAARGKFEMPELNPAYMYELNTMIAQADEDEEKAKGTYGWPTTGL